MGNNKILMLLCTTIILTGCWDSEEIQDRGYILGIAIDKAQPIPRGHEEKENYLSERELEQMPLQKGEPKYAYTLQLPILANIKNKPSGAGGGGDGGAGKEAVWDATMRGNSFMEANREFSTRLEFPPYYEHLQAIIMNEDVAKKGLSHVLDIFLRDHEMRRRTRLVVTPQEAKKILDVKPQIADFSSFYLAELPHNADRTSRLLHITDLGAVAESIHQNSDFVLPRVIATEDEIKDAGCGVFKGDKLVGWLGEVDTIYLKWIRDAVKGGVLVLSMPNEEGMVTLEVKKAKTKKTAIIQEDTIKIKIDVNVSFDLAERMDAHHGSALDETFIKKVENIAETELKKRMISTIQYVQKNFGADVFHFNVPIKKKNYRYWEEIQDQWHEIFPQIETLVNVKAEIHSIGTMK
ncbi:Ger(x)C family spore germination protein [Clostridiaceae bacterium 35-E11]